MASSDGSTHDLTSILTLIARLTTAQHAMLDRIGAHSHPVTVVELAEESGLHTNSVRETVEVLSNMGLVVREQLPATGRGRPSYAYSTTTPADPAFPVRILHQVTEAMTRWIQETCEAPKEAARKIGNYWGDLALESLGVPEHEPTSKIMKHFSLENHMGKIRLFMMAFGFAAEPSGPTSFSIHACSLSDDPIPNPLILEMRRGMVERVLDRTAGRMADYEFIPGSGAEAEVVLKRRTMEEDNQFAIRIRYFGGAAEAAECDSELIATSSKLTHVSDLIHHLVSLHPALKPVMEVSSFLVDERPAERDTPLLAGALVDVLPPFAGG